MENLTGEQNEGNISPELRKALTQTPNDENGRLWFTDTPQLNLQPARLFKRAAEAVLYGLATPDIYTERNGSKYEIVAGITRQTAQFFPLQIRTPVSEIASKLWYDGTAPLIDERGKPVKLNKSTIMAVSGESIVHRVGKYVIKVRKIRPFNGMTPDMLAAHATLERDIHYSLLSDTGTQIPEEHYVISMDPRTGLPTVIIIQPYINGLKDLYALTPPEILRLDESLTICLEKLLSRILTAYHNTRVVPDIIGPKNLCISREGIYDIDPHVLLRIGISSVLDTKIMKMLAKTVKILRATRNIMGINRLDDLYL